MIDETRVQEILNEICEGVQPKRNKTGFVARCPVCGDSKKSHKIKRLHTDFYAKYNDWVCTCYNGGCSFHSGNIYSLYATVKGVTFKEAKKYIEDDVYDPNKIIQSLSGSKAPEVSEEQNHQSFDLYDYDILYYNDTLTNQCSKIEHRYHKALIDFCKNRMIPQEYAEKMMIAYKGKYQGRVIVPIFINGRLEYFQGRSLFDNIEPKYLNPVVDKDMIISNSDKFSRDKYIIVSEGLIDSWMVEDNQGTSLNGGYFNDILIKALLSMTDKGVILVPDNPYIDKAGKEELQKYMKEGKYAGKVKYFIIPDKDIKDLNEFRIKNPDLNIYQYIIDNMINKFAAEIKLDISGW